MIILGLSEKIEKLIDIGIELEARGCYNNCAIEDLLKYSWVGLCDYAIKLLEEIKNE